MKRKEKLLLAVKKATGKIIEQGEDGFACQLPRKGGYNYSLCVVLSWGMGWDHVSVHAMHQKGNFTPFWEDMCYVKTLFFKPSETAVQYHPSSDVYINVHKNTLHLWRSQNDEIKLPPIETV